MSFARRYDDLPITKQVMPISRGSVRYCHGWCRQPKSLGTLDKWHASPLANGASNYAGFINRKWFAPGGDVGVDTEINQVSVQDRHVALHIAWVMTQVINQFDFVTTNRLKIACELLELTRSSTLS